MSQEINERILEALNAGYDPQEILGALSMSKDPGHQSWYENYSQTMRDRARETDIIDQRPKPASTSNISTVKQHIEETPFLQLGAEAAGLAAVPYVGKRIIDRLLPSASEKQYAEQNRIAAEKLKAGQSGEISPLEQARIDTEKAKAEAIRKKIEMMDKKMAQEEMKKSSLATPTATPQGPPPPLKDASLVESGLQNTFQNELNKQVADLQKSAAVPGSVAPNVAPQPVAPQITSVAPYEQGRMAGMMAQQEMANPLGGQASAYTEPLRPAAPPTTEPSKNKGGRPQGSKTLTAEERAAKEAAKGINMYRNLFGFEPSNPTSAKSLAAIDSTDRFIQESFAGKIPGSRDPFLNPSTDVGASGKKFYSGTPEGYRNNYIPWLEKNLNTLPPETQSHILQSMTKGQTADIGKLLKGLGIAATGLGAAGIAFAETPKERQAAAKELAFDVATGIPLAAAVGGPAAAVGAMALGSSGLNAREQEQLDRIRQKERQAALLGSPFADTEWAKKQRMGVPPPR
jgi:hypothetical protein